MICHELGSVSGSAVEKTAAGFSSLPHFVPAGRNQEAIIGKGDCTSAKTLGGQSLLPLRLGDVSKEQAGVIGKAAVTHRSAPDRSNCEAVGCVRHSSLLR
jgi:hypothetical protein